MAFKIVSGGLKSGGTATLEPEKDLIPKFKVISGGVKTAPETTSKFKVVSTPATTPKFTGKTIQSIATNPIVSKALDVVTKIMPMQDWEKLQQEQGSIGKAAAELPGAVGRIMAFRGQPKDVSTLGTAFTGAIEPLGRIYEPTIRAPLRATAQNIRALISPETTKPVGVKQLLQESAKAFFQPKSVTPITRTAFPLTKPELESKGIMPLIPRAIAEAIESVLVYSPTINTPAVKTLREGINELITKKSKVSYKQSLEEAKNVINQYKEPGSLATKAEQLSKEGQIIPLAEGQAKQVENQIRNLWSKQIYQSRLSKTPVKLLKPEELFGAQPKGTLLLPKLVSEKGQLVLPFNEGDIVNFGKESGKILKLGAEKALLSIGGKEIEAKLSEISPIAPKMAGISVPQPPVAPITPQEGIVTPSVFTGKVMPQPTEGKVTPFDPNNFKPGEEVNLIKNANIGTGKYNPGEVYIENVNGRKRPIIVSKKNPDGSIEGFYVGALSETERDFGMSPDTLSPGKWLGKTSVGTIENYIPKRKKLSTPTGEGLSEYKPGQGTFKEQVDKAIEKLLADKMVSRDYTLAKEEVFPDAMGRLFKEERDYIQKAIVESKSPKQIAKELNEDIEDTQKGIKWAIEHYREVEDEIRQEMEEAGGEEEYAVKQQLKSALAGTLKPELKLQGEFSNLKHLDWLFSDRGRNVDEWTEPIEEITGTTVGSSSEAMRIVESYFDTEIQEKSKVFAGKVERQAQAKLKAGLQKKYRQPKPTKPERQETQVGRGTVLNTKADTNRSKMIQIMENMPSALLGNKAEVLSRISTGLKNLLTQGIEKVYDLFGGAKGYRAGLFPNLPSENYNLNEFSDERYNYYKNIQNPQKLEVMKSTIKDLRARLIDRIAQVFEIPQNRYSPEELRKAINKWLQRGLEKERAIFAREVIQKYGNELLAQAVTDKFQSPESSAIYYFLQNTSVFGLSKGAFGYHWSQGIIRSTGEKAEIRDSMRRIEEADKQLNMEAKRDANMPLTQKDGWQVMDEITAQINAGKLNPQTTVILIDPQYLNPTQAEGTYTVGQKDTSWTGHKDNLEKHLLPLIKTGAKIIYTNNEDINLTRWLKANKLPYNIEEAIGATALRGGRDEIISFINYPLSKEYTGRISVGAIGTPTESQYLGEEITGESRTFQEWLVERQRLEREGKVKPPSFGREWTPEQRKSLYVQALNKGLIYKDYTGKEHDMLHGLIRFYPGASFDQLREYISRLTGDPQNPPKLFKLFADITKDTEAIKLLKQVSDKWVDINKLEMNTLDPVRIVEKVTQQDLWDNILGDNTFSVYAAADEAMYDRLVKELNDLEANRQGVLKGSKESSEIMRKFETGESLSEKEQKVVAYLRRKYDALISEANEMRIRLKKRPIPYRKDYMTHIREQNLLSNFFKGDIDQMNSISQSQLDAIRKGDYTKGNMPFNRFALKRTGPRTKYDAIGNYEIYLKIILKEIYYTPAITHARKFIEYALVRQPNAYKALDRLANDLKGKTSINDQWLGGQILSSRAIKKIRSLQAKSALLGNINFWLMNASNFAISYDELGNYMNKGMVKFLGTKKWREFAFKHSNMLKGRTIDPDIDPGSFKTLQEAVGYVTNLLEYNNVGSTFIGAYFKGIDLGYTQTKAIKYADAIARRTQVGYKKYELNAWMRSNSGMFLSQFQTWTFNMMNHLIYDLKLGNIPQNLLRKFTGKEKKPVRWGAFFTLVAISMLLNYLYEKAGLRQPYGPESATPRIPGIGGAVPPVIRTGQNIVTAFRGKKPETRQKAAMRAGASFVPMGTQLGRFFTGRVLPEGKKQSTQQPTTRFTGQSFQPKFTGTKFKKRF